MIPGDIGAEIAGLLAAGAGAGELPAQAASLGAAGTWRPAPADARGGPGTYATSLPLALAGLVGRPARQIAALLASGLADLPWISTARVTGRGYLTVTVTTGHLVGLAARMATAGQAAANSDALAGVRLAAPVLPDPGAAASWAQAWRRNRGAVSGRLARAAGAEVVFSDFQQNLSAASNTQAGPSEVRTAASESVSSSAAIAGQGGGVEAAVAYHGADAVRYALARTSAPSADRISRQLALRLDLANPFVAVRYAHADAASTLRWAASLGPAQDRTAGREPAMAGSALGQPAREPAADELLPPELSLLDVMSWLPERVAAAARRRRPAELAAYLEHLAVIWLDCNQACPALPFRGAAAPREAAGTQAAARLGRADAARVALACGLGLLGVSAPDRL
jgi:arginyl-tRNA synthetase